MRNTQLKNQQKNFTGEHRLVFQLIDPDYTKLMAEKANIKKEVRENVEKRKTELANIINDADKKPGATPDDLKREARAATDIIIKDEFNKVLLNKHINKTLDDLRKDSVTKGSVEADLKEGQEEAYLEVDKALDKYLKDKEAAKKAAAASLATVPPVAPAPPAPPVAPPVAPRLGPTASPNAGRIRLNSEIQASSSQKTILQTAVEMGKRKTTTDTLKALDTYKIEKSIHEMTDPDVKGAAIADYEGWSVIGLVGDTNKNNKTRSTLEGVLAAGYIFTNDEAAGDKHRDERLAMAKGIYDKSADDRFYNKVDFLKKNIDTKGFEYDDIEVTMGLAKYLKEAEKYKPASDKVKGAIAGIFRYMDDTSMFPPALRTEYAKYLQKELSDPAFKDSKVESDQMNRLFALKPPELFMRSNLEIRKNSLKEDGLKVMDLLPGFRYDTAAPDGFYKFLMGGHDSTFNLPNTTMSMEDKYKLLGKIEQSGTKEITDYQDNIANKLKRDAGSKLQLVNGKNKELGRKVLDDSALQDLKSRYDKLSMDFLANYNFLNKGNLNSLTASPFVRDFPKTQLNFLDYMDDLDRKLVEIQASKAAETPPVAPPIVPPVIPTTPGTAPTSPGKTPSTTPKAPEKADGSDIYARDWKTENKSKAPRNPDHTGPMVVKFETRDETGWTHVRMRKNEDGKVLVEIPRNAVVYRDENLQAKMVNNKTFLKVRFLDPEDSNKPKTGWVDESVLFPKNPETVVTPVPPKGPDLPKLPENVDYPVRNAHYKEIFDRVARDVETTPTGVIFNDAFNLQFIEYRVIKDQGKYHLQFAYDILTHNDLVFDSVRAIRDHFDTGMMHRDLSFELLKRPELYKRFTESRPIMNSPITERVIKDKFVIVPPSSIDMELDWKSRKNFDNLSGNAALHLDVLPNGKIVYRIKCQYVAPDGGFWRQGIAEDLNDLFEKLAHAKAWSEGYINPSPEQKASEALLLTTSEERSFHDYQSRIGRPLLFQTLFEPFPVSYIALDWDGTGTASTKNPVLTVSPTRQNTLNYTIHFSTGKADSQGRPAEGMGTFGEAKDFKTLIEEVARLRKDQSSFKSWTDPHNRPYDFDKRFARRYDLPPPL